MFARHESFYPRVGWLWKAVTKSETMPDVFLRQDATVELGVGKNMVRAIRYWGEATRVIEEYPDPARPRRNLARATPMGRVIFGSDGWDPYLEEPRTIWLLHWLLTRSPSQASAWQLLFGLWWRSDFGEGDAVAWLQERVRREPDWPEIAEASLRRDVQCLLQMYGPSRRQNRADDLVESPFREIGLVAHATGDNGRWRFVYGPKPGLTPAVIAFACLDYAARESTGPTLTISRLALEPFSPGLMLRLTESQIARALEVVANEHAALDVITPVGVRQMHFKGEASGLALEVLAADYGRNLAATAIGELLTSQATTGIGSV